MKGRSIFGLMVGLSFLGADLVTRQLSATAAPAPIFRHLVRDIQNQLPRKLVFRLPSNIPARITRRGNPRWGNPKIEFQVDSDSATLKIIQPGCERDFQPGGRGYAINCIPFSISSSILLSQNSRERLGGNVFNLNNRLHAYHFQGDGFNIIWWIQEGIYFDIYSPYMSYNELLQVARSMANEPPIYDIAAANSRIAAGRSPNSGQQTISGRSQVLSSQSRRTIPFTICSESQTWVRPSDSEQISKLQSYAGRYGDLSEIRSIQRVWASNTIFLFTSYGGSSFYDYNHLSGLWSVRDASPWKCGAGKNVMGINSRQIAEVWLFQHRLIKIEWQGNRYIMVVQPTQRGVQIIQFPRVERQSSLLLKVVNELGQEFIGNQIRYGPEMAWRSPSSVHSNHHQR